MGTRDFDQCSRVKGIFRGVFCGLLISLSFLVVACGQNGNLKNPFRHLVIDSHPNTGKDCCTDICMLGDINGDGNLDVVIGGEHAEKFGLVWYEYPTWEKHPVASGEFTTDGKIADMDGDGDPDIVIGTASPGKEATIWFENVSGSGKGEWIPHWVGQGYAHDVEVGDLDGDGDLDIVTCDKKKVIVWEQVTPFFFRKHVILERPGEGIALKDIDGDGDLDIVYGGSWLENPGSLKATPWVSHLIAPKWSPDTRVFVADMNKDGRPDVVLSFSEGKGPLSWFECPRDPRTDAWIEHPVEKGMLEGAHSLQVADVDGDGDLDIITAEMHTSKKKRVLVYLNEGGLFKPMKLARTGSHNMQAGDIDGDGDIDIVGKNYAGPGRVIEMWKNLTSDAKKWKYTSVDRDRPKSQKGKMGLCFSDVNHDGFKDIIAGSFIYLNPGGRLEEEWKRVKLPDDRDVFFALDVNGNKRADLVGIAGDTVIWLEANDEKGETWKSTPVGKVGKGRTQGYTMAALIPGKKPQLIFTRGKNLYVLEIPENPERSPWPLHRISTENEEEGLTVGDINGDGLPDIAAVHGDGHQVVWFENPGSLTVQWKIHIIGKQIDPSQCWLDRIALGDMNGDGRPDIIATEERQDWKLAAHLYWFEAPADPRTGEWKRHTVARHRSLNSMDIADVNGDGVMDIVVAEHTDQTDKGEGAKDNLTVVYLNRDRGRIWQPQVVERGPHSSHLGARLVDLDNDGVLELVSIGWNQYSYVHLWKKVVPDYSRQKSNGPLESRPKPGLKR